MNTIQSDILLSKKTEAFQTLQIFSRLYKYGIRCSNEQSTFIEDEIQFLNQYLVMEHLRFENRKFPTNISCGVLKQQLLVPTFVMQSFIENAVLLSLEHKKDKGFAIQITQEDDFVCMRIQMTYLKGVLYHPKIQQKVVLAEQRLALLSEQRLCAYKLSWQKDDFMELKINFTEN